MLVFSKVVVGNLNLVKRPFSVFISCWFLILGTLASLASAYLSRNDPVMLDWMARGALPVAAQYAILIGGLALTLVAALAMLQGYRGGRTAYVVFSLIDIALAFATVPVKTGVLPGVVAFVVVCALLFSPKANGYFSPRRAANDA